ncbi:MAG: protein kinase domain-containing protein [Isosphaeraceae bacterium]
MMKPLLASVRVAGGPDRVGHVVQLLEEEWRKHGDVPLARRWVEQQRHLGPDGPDRIVLLREMVRTDLRCRYARGQSPTIADYLEQFPALGEADTRVLSLLYEEFCLKEERGDPIDVESFCERYPQWKDSLASQLQYHHLLSRAAGIRPRAPEFPEPGDTFEEFQLLSLLGRGGTARVFLARDLSLGGKRIVLKVSPDRGREPQAQGALDHPHIVPVNSVVFDDRQMRGLSMPYRPGLPLDEVIRRVAPAARPRRALALWEALHRPAEFPADGSSESPADAAPPDRAAPPLPRGDGWDGFPVRGRYADGVAWIVRVVADALHYAHSQDTFHRDVKPANILLTTGHGPQLLDFNLAESPHSVAQAQAAMHGGTLPYMAPEQIEAFFKPELWPEVGARADIYSLGLVLRELLTGQAPELPAETLSPPRAMRVLLDRRPLMDVSVRRANPAIPHALEAVVARCLTVDPEKRYQSAGDLVEDLDRFIQRRPLIHAVNPSRREKSANWLVRNRLAVSGFLASLLPIAFVLGLAIGRAATPPGPSIPVQSSPILRDAFGALSKGNALEAIETLEKLVELYPKSSLPRLCLCLAHDARKRNDRAANRFEEVLRIPDHVAELSSWNDAYPILANRVNEYADHLHDWGKELKNNPQLAPGARAQESSRPFVLEKTARELARAICRPTSTDAPPDEFHTALADEGLGDYDSVYSRATRVIESIDARQPAGPIAANWHVVMLLERERFQWAWLRSRVGTNLADRVRQSGIPADNRKALRYLSDAAKDLGRCVRFVEMFTKDPRETHWVEALRAPAMLSLAEVEIDLGELDHVDDHLAAARHAIRMYRSLSRQIEGSDAPSRGVVQKYLGLWENRLRAATEQVNRKKAEASSPPLVK